MTAEIEAIDRSGREAAAFLYRGTIPKISGLRALAVLLVMLSHYGFGDKVPGGLGVTIFFFISGFLITILALREIAATGRLSLPRFYARRLLRLQPELAFYLAVSASVGVFYIGFPRPIDFFSAIFYVTNYVDAFSKTLGTAVDLRWPHLWSLAVEEHYYLLFPLCFIFLCAERMRHLCMALIVTLLAWRIVLTSAGVGASYTYVATDTRMDSIAFGCLTALLLWRAPDLIESCNDKAWRIFSLSGSLLAASIAIRSPWFRETARYSIQGVALSLALVAAMTPRGRAMTAPLDAPIFDWMGRMSYGAYLWHLETRHVFDRFVFPMDDMLPFPQAASLSLIGVAATFLLAALSYRFVQRPLLPLRRWLGSHAD